VKTTKSNGILLVLLSALLMQWALPGYCSNNSDQSHKPTGSAPAKIESGEDLLKRARHNKQMFDDEEAINCYSKYLSTHPNDDAVRLERAEEYRNEHRFDECIADYQKLINSKNKYSASNAATELGKLYQKQGKYKDAIKTLKIARQLGVKTLLTEISDCARLSGDNEMALQMSSEILKSGDEFNGREHRARALMALKQPRQALIDFDFLVKTQREKIQRIDKESREIYPAFKMLVELLGERASCYETLKDTKRALEDKAAVRKVEQELYNESPFLTKDKK
jgi:tetratricopeptide (TPR) repeat protein